MDFIEAWQIRIAYKELNRESGKPFFSFMEIPVLTERGISNSIVSYLIIIISSHSIFRVAVSV